jgi:hypothetical protein
MKGEDMEAESATTSMGPQSTEPIGRDEALRVLGRMVGRAVEPIEVRYLIGVRDGFEDPVVFAVDLGDEAMRGLADMANGPGYSAGRIARCAPGTTPAVMWVMPCVDAVALAGRFAPDCAATLAEPAWDGCFKVLLASEGLVFASGGFPKPPE